MKKLRFGFILCLSVCLLLSAALAEPRQLESLSDMPETDGEGFLPGEDPVYYRDFEGGHWFYVGADVRVEITRTQTKKPLLTYYLADIRLAEGSSLYTVSYNEDRPGRTNGLPQDMAKRVGAVYAQSGDFYSYRVKNDRYPGNIVRNGKVLYNKTYSKMVHATPNLATIGFWSSGRAEVNESWKKTAKQYVKEGADTVLAFGPLLIVDGEIQDLTDKAYCHTEPRSCFGIIEPGHFAGLLVEGRKTHSDGATLQTCAEILQDFGCTDAINLDGGNTAAMLFMGQSVQMNSRGGVDENDRAIPDILAAGRMNP